MRIFAKEGAGMLGRYMSLLVAGLLLVPMLGGCSSENAGGVAIPVWDSAAAAVR